MLGRKPLPLRVVIAPPPWIRAGLTIVKINIDIDCTPHEARAFFGLPYVKPMQDAMMARIEREMLDAVAAMSPDAVMKMWFQLMPENPEQMREMFTRFFAQPFGPAPTGRS